MRDGPLRAAPRAPIALPSLIAAALLRDRWLVDGGLVNPVPVSLCRALGADSVIAVDLNTALLGRRLVPDKPEREVRSGVGPDIGGGLGARLRDLAADLRGRMSGDSAEERDDTPTIYEVMANSVNIMQVRIGRSRMSGDPPELLVTPRLEDFGILDFDRAAEAIDEGRRALARTLGALAGG